MKPTTLSSRLKAMETRDQNSKRSRSRNCLLKLRYSKSWAINCSKRQETYHNPTSQRGIHQLAAQQPKLNPSLTFRVPNIQNAQLQNNCPGGSLANKIIERGYEPCSSLYAITMRIKCGRSSARILSLIRALWASTVFVLMSSLAAISRLESPSATRSSVSFSRTVMRLMLFSTSARSSPTKSQSTS